MISLCRGGYHPPLHCNIQDFPQLNCQESYLPDARLPNSKFRVILSSTKIFVDHDWEDMDMNFGTTINALRKQKNVTQEEMAAELGITAAAVSKWENGVSQT